MIGANAIDDSSTVCSRLATSATFITAINAAILSMTLGINMHIEGFAARFRIIDGSLRCCKPRALAVHALSIMVPA